ncbi:MAG: hypothetical protein SGPRY_004997 [Prymnesium sp.]
MASARLQFINSLPATPPRSPQHAQLSSLSSREGGEEKDRSRSLTTPASTFTPLATNGAHKKSATALPAPPKANPPSAFAPTTQELQAQISLMAGAIKAMQQELLQLKAKQSSIASLQEELRALKSEKRAPQLSSPSREEFEAFKQEARASAATLSRSIQQLIQGSPDDREALPPPPLPKQSAKPSHCVGVRVVGEAAARLGELQARMVARFGIPAAMRVPKASLHVALLHARMADGSAVRKGREAFMSCEESAAALLGQGGELSVQGLAFLEPEVLCAKVRMDDAASRLAAWGSEQLLPVLREGGVEAWVPETLHVALFSLGRSANARGFSPAKIKQCLNSAAATAQLGSFPLGELQLLALSLAAPDGQYKSEAKLGSPNPTPPHPTVTLPPPPLRELTAPPPKPKPTGVCVSPPLLQAVNRPSSGAVALNSLNPGRVAKPFPPAAGGGQPEGKLRADAAGAPSCNAKAVLRSEIHVLNESSVCFSIRVL